MLFRAKPQPRTDLATSLLMGAILLASPLLAVAQEGFSWTETFLEQIAKVDANTSGELGIYLKDLDTGVSASYHGEEAWYLASTVKVPVAIAVMRRIDQDTLTLDSTLRLLESDYVDGAGPTKRHAPGTELSVRYLMDQMLIHSDNTASDMLIRLVGLDAVNAVTRELVPEGFGPITTLADVRRLIYGELHRPPALRQGFPFAQSAAQRSRPPLASGQPAGRPAERFHQNPVARRL